MPRPRCPLHLAQILYLGLLLVLLSADARSPLWKPERLPGSAQLAWHELRWLQAPAGAGEELRAALKELRELAAGRGIPLEIIDSGAAAPKQSLRFELGGEVGLLADGFVVRREGTRVAVRAAEEAGLVNAVYTLAQEGLGARWYWPGEIGFQWVGAVGKLPDRINFFVPDFVQRTLHPVHTDYGRRNRLNRSYRFNHNLAEIFTRDAFAQEPDAFATIEGRRRGPRGSRKLDAQPDFTSPAAVELAIAAARQHFDDNPEANSFSLSINDNWLFDQGPRTEAVVSPVNYFRRMPNYTDLVFGFMNEVADAVFADSRYLTTESGQPRYLTALAYYWTEQSPSFALHPRIMPVLTSDRGQWHDPDYRREDKALIRRWAETGVERLATWDYYFGAPYPYPRQFTRWISESIPFLRQQGVDVFFSQLPSVWGLDGPKAWLAAQLLWDSEQDAEALLSEYYTAFFGAAGPAMREFYERAEARREAVEGTAWWIKFYKDEAGIELFDRPTLAAMRSSLERAKQAVADDPQRSARVAVVDVVFAFTEAYHAMQAARRDLVENSLAAWRNDSAIRPDELVAARTEWHLRRTAFREVREGLRDDPMHASLRYFDRIFQSEPSALALAALARLGAGDDLALTTAEAAAYGAVQALVGAEGGAVSVLRNAGLKMDGSERRNFLGPELPILPDWRIQYRPSEGLAVTALNGEDGGGGIRIENADIVSIDQTVPVLAEKNYLLEIDAAWRVSPDNRVWVQLVWEDFTGNDLGSEVLLRLPSARRPNAGRLRFALRSPANTYDLKISVVTNRQYAGDFLELRRIDFSEIVPSRNGE